MKDPVITDLLKYLLLVQHPPVVLEVGDVSSLPPFSRCPLDLDVVPSSCVPISAHLEVQRSTPTPSFNLEPDGGNLVEKKASGTCFFSVHQTAPSKAKTPRPTAAHGRIGAITVVMHNVKLDRKRFRLSKEVEATHWGAVEPMAFNLVSHGATPTSVREFTNDVNAFQ